MNNVTIGITIIGLYVLWALIHGHWWRVSSWLDDRRLDRAIRRREQ